jgi:hypothetical protein
VKIASKKFLPVFLFILGIAVLGVVFFFITRSTDETGSPDEVENIPEVVLEDRPIVSLIPNEDGHWLKLVIEKFKIPAASLDYELLYSLPDGRTQGVPGTIALKDETSIERNLLLGSESSGKFRYDEGVEEGTLTLRFRDEKGKLQARFQTRFHLQADTMELSSADGKAKFTLTKTPKKVFFITMETFGIPLATPGALTSGPWGVFSSSSASFTAEVDLGSAKVYRASGTKWLEVAKAADFDFGIFVGTSE